mmetsp:Transcript_53029/g.120929  ORF Transcript_53029/g.120929 Transcript_53029/m.120929 type:complete len:484 (+) Transcript_53029:2-1453(+)
MSGKLIKDHAGNEEFCVAVLGDLHLDPTDMGLHEEGRAQIKALLDKEVTAQRHVVSLGDLGAYGIAGTTPVFELSKKYLRGFGQSFDLVTGNHDLEGMDEFDTDAENLQAWMDTFGRDSPSFCTEIAHKILCVGLSTVRFRDTEYSSHEVFVDDKQIAWFQEVLERHPASKGWKILVFTHAPIMGSGLRTLQGVHVKNGCAWINHTDERTRGRFIELCNKHSAIKAWFSGHFHLSHDYPESITVGGEHHQAFVQVGVIGEKSQRDGRRQTRMVRGNAEGLKVYTVNHHQDGRERLDMELKFGEPGDDPQVTFPDDHEEWITPDTDKWFSARIPLLDDGCFIESFLNQNPEADGVVTVSGNKDKVCWWHMDDGKVLGVHDGTVIEYDPTTLSPLGIVVDEEAFEGKELMIASAPVGESVAGKAAMLVWEGDGGLEQSVIQPNPDGSYWRKFQRNKLQRTREKERDAFAKAALARMTKGKNAASA